MVEPSRVPLSAAETILVVEDEVLVRLEISDYLRECGYRVVEADTADEAIAILQTGQHVDLVFSDVQLPGASDGFGLARWVRANRPGTKVTLTSGVARSMELARELCEAVPIEAKPYHPRQIVERIRKTLA